LSVGRAVEQPAASASTAAEPSEVMAAVDLGSNSFHMVVARLHHGQLLIIDRLREMVQLANGLTPRGYLDAGSQERALACLRRFGQRLREMRAHQVRVVGTNTLRRARNSAAFLGAAEEALGHPVEVISGIEEARLIYLGVSHNVAGIEGSTLVIDIGGGSTELIIGEGYEPRHLESLFMGCVGLSRRFFDAGKLGNKRFQRARIWARLELRPIAGRFRRIGWQRAVGSSGTVRAAGDIARALGLADSGVTIEALEQIIERMVAARRVENLKLPELNPERAPVLAGGVVILVETMKALGIERLQISDGALREGLLYDMLGRLQHEDARELTIRAMLSRYHVDGAQAARVEETARGLLERTRLAWGLTDSRYQSLLLWAARLHEVGLDIAHAKYHQHGGYLLANADLPGFNHLEQQLLSKLVAFHRRKLQYLDLEDVPAGWRQPLFQLLVLLRLAVLLNRGRSSTELPEIALIARERLLDILFPSGWLAENPLTQADLEQEQAWLRARGFTLRVDSVDSRREAQEDSAS
jgi:exopolyphosphatase/guanosine-5'-triphosphate,3'-diphosphate pyrophosphatase